MGDLSKGAPLLRIHSQCFTGEALGSLRCDCGDQLAMAMQAIADEGRGLVIYEYQEGRGIGLMAKLQAYELQDAGIDTVEANHALGFKADYRDFSLPAAILRDLGVSRVRLLTNNPHKAHALTDAGIEVVAQIPCEVAPTSHSFGLPAGQEGKNGPRAEPSTLRRHRITRERRGERHVRLARQRSQPNRRRQPARSRHRRPTLTMKGKTMTEFKPPSRDLHRAPTPRSAVSSSSISQADAFLSANPDGSDLKTIVEEGRKLPDGLVVDSAAGHMYWTNMGNPKANDGSILRSDLDGKNMTTIVPPGGTFTPKQLQLEKKSGKLYWCDREGMRVMRANLDGSNIETLVDTSEGDPRPGPDARKWCVGIAVDAAGGKFYWTQKGRRQRRPGPHLPREYRASARPDTGQPPRHRTPL